jgi:ABC-type Na+ efflux pump permease subunit
MWILDFLPGWIFTLITVVSLGAFLVTEFLNKIPFVALYLKTIRIASIVGLVIGLYMMGGSANQEKWEARVKELEAKVAIAEEQSKTANAKLDAKMKEKAKVIKEKEYIIQEKLVKVKEQIDAMCQIPVEAIKLLNEAAEERK